MPLKRRGEAVGVERPKQAVRYDITCLVYKSGMLHFDVTATRSHKTTGTGDSVPFSLHDIAASLADASHGGGMNKPLVMDLPDTNAESIRECAGV